MKHFANSRSDRGKLKILRDAAEAARLQVAGSPGADPIHDLRVATRRLEQGVKVFRGSLDPAVRKELQRMMKQWMRATGKVRNCDIAMQDLEDGGTRKDLDAERTRMTAKLHAKLEKPLPELPLVPDDSLSPEAVADALRKPAKTFFKTGAHLASHKKPDLKELHELRLAGKALRYRLELLANHYGPKATELIDQVKKTQTTLGDMNDSRSSERLFAKFNAPRKLIRASKETARKHVGNFQKDWPEMFADPGPWISFLEQAHPEPVRKSPRKAAKKKA
jgi:CHAD domain-containing protein